MDSQDKFIFKCTLCSVELDEREYDTEAILEHLFKVHFHLVTALAEAIFVAIEKTESS